MARVGESATWIIFLLVVLAAASTLLPLDEPAIPGAIQLVALEGPGARGTEQALRPFCDYLSRALDLNTRPWAVAGETLREAGDAAQLLLGPLELLPTGEGFEVLAWAKGPGLRAEYERPCVVFPADSLWLKEPSPRLIQGDPWTWAGGRGAADYLARHDRPLDTAFARRGAGRNAYDHLEAVSAMAHGAYDLAVVRESDLLRALEMGMVDTTRFRYEAAGPPGGGLALVATPRLSEAARRRVRSAVLSLDAYRFDPQHLLAANALSGLRALGIEGFVPDRVLPNLRP